MSNQHLLFELGTEELPPKNLLKLSQALLNNICQGLQAAELSFSASRAYATPRRLAVVIENLATTQPDKTLEKRGPTLQAAFTPDGAPSKATLGFAASCGTTVEQLQRLKTDKGEWLSFTQTVPGQLTEQLLPDIIRHSIAALPIAKRMRWGSSTTEFVRPVHWVLLLWGDQVIDAEILGLKTGSTTMGHRFHAPEAITVDKPENYVETLYRLGHVVVDVEQRKGLIREAAQQAANLLGGHAHIEEDLLEEVAALNEWPVPIMGSFDTRYLSLPAEVLITTMQTNQKYFPVKNEQGQLLANFITFSNIDSSNPDVIRQGNERVVVPRLSDAEFFWNQDRKKTLEDRVESLSSVIFQEKLGTVYQKTLRVQAIAQYLAEQLHADIALAKRAALLAKTDLMTEMVGEFGNLQGIMGRYYALVDNESVELAQALEEQYFPKQSGSPTAASRTGQILAIAEKTDTLTGIFAAGLIPTGDKDPYALRRAALGILRTIIENQLDIDLLGLIQFASRQLNQIADPENITSQVSHFVHERLRGYCLDQGYAANEFDAVIAVSPGKPVDFMRRLQAVKAFRKLPEAESLAAANKRIRNILKKLPEPPADTIGLLPEVAEQQLLQAAINAQKTIEPLLEQQDYQAALNELANLRNTIDVFFDQIMVMTDDLELRASRLALLNLLSKQFLSCADISRLQS